VHDLVLGGTDPTSLGRIAHEVEASIRRWEPRVKVVSVEPAPDPSDPSFVYVTVNYKIRETNDSRNLVFPFYVIPAEELDELAPDAPKLLEGSR
jgi:phage baseplate assembly protein W